MITHGEEFVGASYGGARLWGGGTLLVEHGAIRTIQSVSPAPLQMRRWHLMDGVVLHLRQKRCRIVPAFFIRAFYSFSTLSLPTSGSSLQASPITSTRHR